MKRLRNFESKLQIDQSSLLLTSEWQ